MVSTKKQIKLLESESIPKSSNEEEVVMALEIKPSIVDKLPTMVNSALNNMSTEEQMMFQEQYEKKSRSTGLMIFLAIIFPIQLFLLEKI